MAFSRIIVWALAAPAFAWGAAPEWAVPSQEGAQQLTPHMAVTSSRGDEAIDPERAWNGPGVTLAGEDVALDAGSASVLRARLVLPAGGSWWIQVPSSRLDRARIWMRPAGGAWIAAQAGDRVPLAEWPVFGQWPAFELPSARSVDVVLSLANRGAMRVPVLLWTQHPYTESRTRQAHVSGVMIGMGFMVVVVCAIGAVAQRARPSWVLLGFAALALLTISCINGWAGIWLWPGSPALNDGSKVAVPLLMAAAFFWFVTQFVERIEWRPLRRALAWAGPLAFAGAAATGLALSGPGDFARLPWVLGFTGASIALSLAIALASYARGGRHVGWVLPAHAAYAAALVAYMAPVRLWHGVDPVSATSALMLFACTLMLRHADYQRLRYGRDVVARAAVGARRDTLTALWSYQGMAEQFAQAALRESAGHGPPSMMVFLLRGLETSEGRYGWELTERALVRLAALLQTTLGQDWAIGRISKTRFAAISLRPLGAAQVSDTATLVLTQCSRLEQPLNPVLDFDLRIVWRHRDVTHAGWVERLREMEAEGAALPGNKRITLV